MGQQVITELSERYNSDQKGLIKATFDDATLMALRKFFLQGDLNESEQEIIKGFSLKIEAVKLLKNALIPTLDPSAPIDGLSDTFGSVDLNTTIEYANYDMEARQKSIDYFNGRFDALAGKLKTGINLSDLVFSRKKNNTDNYIDLRARNMYIIQHLEFQVKQLQFFYKQEEKSEEELRETQKKDSVE